MRPTQGARQRSFAIVILLVVGGLAGLAAPASAAATLLVCDAACPYADVASALADAAAGDTVVVRPGVYVGALTIATPLTLCATTAGGSACAPNAAGTILEGIETAPPVTIAASGVTLQGFTIRNPRFALADQGAGAPVEAALVIVQGDDVSIIDNLLASPGNELGALRTRWYTSAVVLRAGSDDITIARNVMNEFPASIGAGAACPTAPCEVVAIRSAGGNGLVIEDNDIRILGTGAPATAIEFANNAGVEIRGNFLRLPGSQPGSGPLVTGIETTSAAAGVVVEENDIAVGLTETPYGLYGVFGVFRDSVFRGNEFKTAQHGIMLRSSFAGGNLVEGNYFFDNNQAILNYANATTIRDNRFYLGASAIVLDSVLGGGSTGVVIEENEFRNHTRYLGITDTVTATYVDARENDWGAYSRALIEARLDDASGTNEIDIRCFIDQDGATRVCPSAGFTDAVVNSAWPREVALSDASVSGGRSIASRTWALPDGSQATGEEASFTAMPGLSTVTLTVTDTEGFEDVLTRAIALDNAAPALPLVSSMGATEGTTFTLALPGSDADGDTLAYSVAGAPAGATLSPATGAFSWDVPFDADGGTYELVFSVTDGAATTTAPLTITVSDEPVAPRITPPGARAIRENSPLEVEIVASDPDGGIVTLAASGLPAGATFVDHGDNTATFSWTPSTGASGSYPIDVTATAQNGLTATEQLLVSVTTATGLTLARTGDINVNGAPGQTITVSALLSNTGSGPDAFTLLARANNAGWTASAGPGVTLAQGASGVVTATVVAPAHGGTTTLTLRACSGAQATLCRDVSWTVRTPLIVTSTMDASFSPAESITGVVRVAWLDGNPVSGATVRIQQRWQPAPLQSEVFVTTNEAGWASYVLESPTARMIGGHDLAFTATLPLGGAGVASRTYRIDV